MQMPLKGVFKLVLTLNQFSFTRFTKSYALFRHCQKNERAFLCQVRIMFILKRLYESEQVRSNLKNVFSINPDHQSMLLHSCNKTAVSPSNTVRLCLHTMNKRIDLVIRAGNNFHLEPHKNSSNDKNLISYRILDFSTFGNLIAYLSL